MKDIKEYFKLSEELKVIENIIMKFKAHIQNTNYFILESCKSDLEIALNEYIFSSHLPYVIVIDNKEEETLNMDCILKTTNNELALAEFTISIYGADLRVPFLYLSEIHTVVSTPHLEGILLFMKKATQIISELAIEVYKKNIFVLEEPKYSRDNDFEMIDFLMIRQEDINVSIKKLLRGNKIKNF